MTNQRVYTACNLISHISLGAALGCWASKDSLILWLVICAISNVIGGYTKPIFVKK